MGYWTGVLAFTELKRIRSARVALFAGIIALVVLAFIFVLLRIRQEMNRNEKNPMRPEAYFSEERRQSLEGLTALIPDLAELEFLSVKTNSQITIRGKASRDAIDSVQKTLRLNGLHSLTVGGNGRILVFTYYYYRTNYCYYYIINRDYWEQIQSNAIHGASIVKPLGDHWIYMRKDG